MPCAFPSRAILSGSILAALSLAPFEPAVSASPQASFDCAKASTPTEKAICRDPSLAALDLALSQAYQARLARDADLRQQQRGWRRARDAGCGEDRACLKAFIRTRLDWMKGSAPMPGRLPTVVGQCSLSRESIKTYRFEGEPTSGSAAGFANGAQQVSYDRVPGIEASRVGDPAVVCLAALPQDCPPGDERGKVYASADLRTLMAWSLPDAEHLCGGA